MIAESTEIKDIKLNKVITKKKFSFSHWNAAT